jgi:hypothetical protein
MILVTSIDVGLVNLGMVMVELRDDYTWNELLFADRIDLTDMPHHTVPRKECTLFHTNDAVDRVEHFIQEYKSYFDDSDHILIERQPLGGLVHVEQLLYRAFRNKTLLCSPNAVHKHFQMAKGDYDKRKQQSTRIAMPYLENHPVLKTCANRIHDISDSICLVLWWISGKQKEWKKEHRPVLDLKDDQSPDSFLEQFRFITSSKELLEPKNEHTTTTTSTHDTNTPFKSTRSRYFAS